MTVVTIHQAATRLSKLLAEVEAGGEVIIARGSVPVARILPEPAKPARLKRTPGRLKGKISIDERFFEPLPDDELALWNGEGD